jgi:hypothetical protein
VIGRAASACAQHAASMIANQSVGTALAAVHPEKIISHALLDVI